MPVNKHFVEILPIEHRPTCGRPTHEIFKKWRYSNVTEAECER